MGDKSCDRSPNNTQLLIDQLLETTNQIDKDDLSGLAKMHGWCEALADTTREDAETTDPALARQATSLRERLESLILGEVEDPEATFGVIIKGVSQLAALNAMPAGDIPIPPGAGSLPAKEDEAAGDDDIQEKLARVFEDEAAGSEEQPAPDSTRVTASASGPSSDEPQAEAPASAGASTADRADAQTACDAGPPYESIPLQIDNKEIEFVKAFVEEAGEHIESIEGALLEVERTPTDTDKINDLFRPFHTIKGMAGFLHLRDVNCLTHEVETLLDQGRKGQRAVTPGLIDLIFDVVDVLKVQSSSIGSHVADPTGETVPQPPVAEMIGRLRNVVAGRIEPDAHEGTAGSSAQRVGENLVEQRVVPQEVVDFALQKQKSDPTGKKAGEILVETGTVTPRQVSQAIRPQAQKAIEGSAAATQKPTGEQSIRIDTGKLDALVDMVGELVIAQTMVNASDQIDSDPRLSKDVGQVTKIVRDVQEVAMAMRMVPIGPTFQKMARLVRDVARKANKRVDLLISGEDTELDKNVIQVIGDPLVHMVRNAVDHGIEPPDVRVAAGKPEMGRVHLDARHQGGNIVIEISDDGKGLDPEVLIAKGIEKGLVQPGQELTDQQAYALILAPGFSTAAQVTDISGRGVGMDVVRRNIDQLRGKVEIASQKGRASTFSIRLPLTLAIIDGMVVRVGRERCIIPTIAIEQSLRPEPNQITTVQHRGEVLNVRGRLIPLIQLGQLFGLTARIDPCETMVVIAHCERQQIGLVIEELIDQQQVVIKTLGQQFEKLLGISGAAILGDGRVGLILEASGLAELHESHVITSDGEHGQDVATETEPTLAPDETEVSETSAPTESQLSDSSAQRVAEPALT